MFRKILNLQIERNRTLLWLSGLFIALFLLSFIWFLLADPGIRRKTLFFPAYGSETVRGEERYLPLRKSDEQNMDLYVRELLLGPVLVEHDPLFPAETDLRSIIYRNGVLYIDLSIEAVTGETVSRLGFYETLETLKRGLRFNFPQVDDIVVAIEGDLPSYLPEEMEN